MGGFAASSYFLSRAFVYPMMFLFGLPGAIPFVTQRLLEQESRPLITKRDAYVYTTIGTAMSVTYIYFSIILLNQA